MPKESPNENSMLDRIGADLYSAAKNAIKQIIKPSIKNLIFESGTYILGNILHIDSPKYTALSKPGENVPYNNMYKGSSNTSNVLDFAAVKEPFTVKSIPFRSLVEATKAREILAASCQTEGKVSVSRYYQITGHKSDWTDSAYGWTNADDIRNAIITQTPNGCYINLPRVKPLH